MHSDGWKRIFNVVNLAFLFCLVPIDKMLFYTCQIVFSFVRELNGSLNLLERETETILIVVNSAWRSNSPTKTIALAAGECVYLYHYSIASDETLGPKARINITFDHTKIAPTVTLSPCV